MLQKAPHSPASATQMASSPARREEIPVSGVEIWRRQVRHERALRLIELPARIRAGRGRPLRRSSDSTRPSALR